ncbi:hypothetical protein D3C85_1044320 [compost metagenome]
MFVVGQRLGPAQQLSFAGRAVIDLFHQPCIFHGLDRVGRDRGQRELFGEPEARSRDLQQFQQAVGAVLIEEEIVELDLLELPDVFNHALGFDLRQVQSVLPQVTVLQAAVFREFFLVGHQGKQSRIAAHQAFPGVQNAVVRTFDVGAEVDRVTEQGGVVGLHIGLIDTQQRMAEHRGGAVEVGRGENHHRAVGRDVLEPLLEFAAVHRRQVGEVELRFQPAGAGRVNALGVLLAQAGGGVERLHGGRQFRVGVLGTLGCQEELFIADVAAPATQFGGFVMPQGNPERVVGQLLQALVVDVRRSGKRGADKQRQTGKAFEHGGQLESKK